MWRAGSDRHGQDSRQGVRGDTNLENQDIARILIYGDIHLNSKNYGSHIDYAKESLECFRKITEVAREHKATHLIGLGDISYSRFHSLEYRSEVEKELMEQYNLVSGNRYELKGNHDSAGYGMTEYEYYIIKGLLKPSCNMTIGNLHITMVDYKKHTTVVPNINLEPGATNVILAHDYYKFKDTPVPNFGKAIELETLKKWYGADYLVCGHIHNQLAFRGFMKKDTLDGEEQRELIIHYPGCITRPAYSEGTLTETGQFVLITVKDSGDVIYDIIEFDLPPIADIFNLSAKKEEKIQKEVKRAQIDISDIIQRMSQRENIDWDHFGIIENMQVEQKYKDKAIELLKAAHNEK